MAKKPDGNPLERHVEKIVLGLCVLALVYVLAHWVVSSPATVKVMDPANPGGDVDVPPDKADDTLLRAAEAVQARNKMASPAQPEPLAWKRQFAEADERPFAQFALLDGGVPFPPIMLPKPRDANALPSLPELASLVPAPGRPGGWQGFEVRKSAPTQEEGVYHGESVYPWGELKKRWEEKLSRLPNANIVVMRVEVQVQSGPHDGNWPGEGAPAQLASLPPTDSEHRGLAMPVIPDFDGNNAEAIRAAVSELAATNWQNYILVPWYDDISSSRGVWVPWRWHLDPNNSVSRLETIPFTAQPGATPPPAPAVAPAPSPGPVRTVGPRPGVPVPSGTPAPARVPSAGPSGIGPVMAETAPPPGVRLTPIPSLDKQKAAGEVLVAFHDNTRVIGQARRYRLRIIFVNPLLGQEAVQNKSRDSYQKEIASPWSEWSQECVIENPTRFFLVGRMPDDSLRVAVFTQKMGQTVKQYFPVADGMAIGGVSKVSITVPGGRKAEVSVDFSTGCVVVATDKNRPYMKRTIIGPGAMQPVPTGAILYLDDKGHLLTRVQAEDEASPEYLNLNRESGGHP